MSRITLLDGAFGTSLWNLAEAAGVKKDPVWTYNMEHPEFPETIVKQYAAAGSKIVQANTFSANALSLKKSQYDITDVIGRGVEITKKALVGTQCLTALSSGPLPEMMDPYGDLEEEEVEEMYAEIIGTGVDAGADIVVLETFMDAEMMRVAAQTATQFHVPVFCTLSFEKTGRTMMGNSVSDVVELLEPLGIEAIGLNCSLGPVQALPIIKEFAETTVLPIIYKPNAGMPDITTGEYELGPEAFADEMMKAANLVSYMGGCCGTSPEYIKELAKRV